VVAAEGVGRHRTAILFITPLAGGGIAW
jgi:hypothetical protein